MDATGKERASTTDAAGIGSARQSLQLVFIGGVLAWTVTLAVTTSRAR